MNNDEVPWVNASDVGKAEFCAYSLYLSQKGVKPSRQSQKKMTQGMQSHRQWDRERVSGWAVWIRFAVVLALIVGAVLLFKR